MLLMLAKTSNEDEDKKYGQQDDGRLNLRKAPRFQRWLQVRMLRRLGPNLGISAYESFTGWSSVASIENTEANQLY